MRGMMNIPSMADKNKVSNKTCIIVVGSFKISAFGYWLLALNSAFSCWLLAFGLLHIGRVLLTANS
jgi:hypothetical protein